ncbi:MAG: glutaredoxin family protein [Kaiparowitsia implicata GSE-PSE-MK54-09C]|jgi:hypothetical protein|nr:glutaredoxin family protein [Kaiparowitsia implicata GSE-PSE-MK54-09C]
MHLIVYSKPDCHLCEGLLEKLAQVDSISLHIEVRDITTRPDWFNAYQYEIPVMYWANLAEQPESAWVPVPRMSPRASVRQMAEMLQKLQSDYQSDYEIESS